MKFQIQELFSINDKTYLLTQSLNDAVSFKLSDHSFLGDFAVENWFDLPRAIDDNGNQKMHTFIFALKNKADKEKIRQEETLNLSNLYTTVVEAFYTVSGKIGSILECGTGMLDIGTVLIDHNKKWKIIENDIPIGRPKDKELQKRVIDNFWFLYFLQPFDHTTQPEVGSKLRVIQNDI